MGWRQALAGRQSAGLKRQRRRLSRLRRVLDSSLEWLSSFRSLSGIAYLLLVVGFAIQVVCLNIFLVRYTMRQDNVQVLLTLFVDVPVFLHILWFWRVDNAHRAAPTQWACYSWVHAAKVVVLFCRVMPRLPAVPDSVHSHDVTVALYGAYFSISGAHVDKLLSPQMLGNLLLLTPLLYALVMFRVSKPLFGSFSSKVTVGLVMHYDMLWHVVVDMVDQVDMFHLARLAESVGPEAVRRNHHSLVAIQSAIPFMLFLSIVLQAQSVPGVVVDFWTIPRATPQQQPGGMWAALAALCRGTREQLGLGAKEGWLKSRADKLCIAAPIPLSGEGPSSAGAEAAAASPSSTGATARRREAPTLARAPAPRIGPSMAARAPAAPSSARPTSSCSEPLAPSTRACGGTPRHARSSSSCRAVAQGVPPRAVSPTWSPFSEVSALEGGRFGMSPTAAHDRGSPSGFGPLRMLPLDTERASLRTSSSGADPGGAQGSSTQPEAAVFRRSGNASLPRRWAGSCVSNAASAGATSHGASVRDSSLGAYKRLAAAARQREKARRSRLQAVLDQITRHSVVLARKRSAMISLFFIDLPFLAVRLWLWVLLASTHKMPLSGFAVKNGICIVLNVMQFPLISVEVRESFQRILKQLAMYRLRFCGPEAAASGAFCTPGMCCRGGVYATAFSRPRGETPPILATPGTLALGGLGSSSNSLGAGIDLAARLAAEERAVRRETTRNTGICAHFWALLLSFLSGLLLATGERFIAQGARQISAWVTRWSQPDI